MRFYAALMKYLSASASSAAVLLVFLALVYPRFGTFSWVVGIPLAAVPWFYFYRRRAPVPPPRASSSPPLTTARVPASMSSTPPAPVGEAVAYSVGDAVACQSCGRSMSIAMPAKDSTGKILVASVDDMIRFALRCRKCDYITCVRCALLAYELHNPRQGIPTCPRCGEVAIPFFTEWLGTKAPRAPAEGMRADAPAERLLPDDLETQGAVQHLLQAPPTSAGFARARAAAGQTLTVFLVREDGDRVRQMPAAVPIEVRSAMLHRLGVEVVVVLLRVDGELYETWWNFHNEVIRQSFEDIRTQDDLIIRFHVDRLEPARTLAIPNPLHGTFDRACQMLSGKPAWTMEGFNAAKAELAGEYPTVQALWDGIAEG